MVIILVLRFNRVSLAKILGLKLDCIFIGDMKLYANATKFKTTSPSRVLHQHESP